MDATDVTTIIKPIVTNISLLFPPVFITSYKNAQTDINEMIARVIPAYKSNLFFFILFFSDFIDGGKMLEVSD